ncbi:hypothetical protein WG66_008458 [Moniliophthora roreri]|nr:hypothetical protein WG66_008458 [Moniliophthora roreri]
MSSKDPQALARVHYSMFWDGFLLSLKVITNTAETPPARTAFIQPLFVYPAGRIMERRSLGEREADGVLSAIEREQAAGS